ncbi:MAG: DUF4440 domain-containing protein [Gammaproteobacteria bacterium]|nr:DUF4440 domain-containing protein [Gammaproteobacteria bacterium]
MMQLASRQTGYRLALAALLGLAFAMPAQADSDKAMELAEEHNADWNRHFNHGDAGPLAELYAEDALVSPANGEVIRGREAIHELFKSYIDGGLHNHRLTVVRADGSGDWFYEVAEWRATGAPERGVMPLYKGIVTIIFRRQDNGDWLIQSHTWNQEPDSAT